METTIGADLQHAATLLTQHHVLAIPTETVYGLAANAHSEAAVKKLFELKNRPLSNPLIVHFKHFENSLLYTHAVSDAIQKLAAAFMPGPLTILLPSNKKISPIVTAGSDKIAVRIPAHATLSALLKLLPFPLAAPSANIFGYVSPTTAQHVLDGFKNKIPYIIDGGPASIGVESTIIEEINGTIVIHRLGAITKEMIEKIISNPVVEKTTTSASLPGQFKKHYSPRTPLAVGNLEQAKDRFPNKKIAAIYLHKNDAPVETPDVFLLSTNNNLTEALHNLYACLRIIDDKQYDLIVAPHFPNEGLGKVLNDKLQRAQTVAL